MAQLFRDANAVLSTNGGLENIFRLGLGLSTLASAQQPRSKALANLATSMDQTMRALRWFVATRATNAILNNTEKDSFLATLKPIRALVDIIYAPVDHINWLVFYRVMRANTGKLGVLASRLWLAMTILDMIKDSYILSNLLQQKGEKDKEDTADIDRQITDCYARMAQNIADFLLAANGSFKLPKALNPTLQGMLHVLSSSIGLLLVYNSVAKH